MSDYRHGWIMGGDLIDRQSGEPQHDGLVHYDLKTGKSTVWQEGPGDRFGEPIFVPRSEDAAEGDGWLLSVLYRGGGEALDLAVFEATDLGRADRPGPPVEPRAGRLPWQPAAGLDLRVPPRGETSGPGRWGITIASKRPFSRRHVIGRHSGAWCRRPWSSAARRRTNSSSRPGQRPVHSKASMRLSTSRVDVHDLKVERRAAQDTDRHAVPQRPQLRNSRRAAPITRFDADGMIHAFHIENGRVSYRNRWVRTPRWLAESMWQCKSLFGGFTNPGLSDPRAADIDSGTAKHQHRLRMPAG